MAGAVRASIGLLTNSDSQPSAFKFMSSSSRTTPSSAAIHQSGPPICCGLSGSILAWFLFFGQLQTFVWFQISGICFDAVLGSPTQVCPRHPPWEAEPSSCRRHGQAPPRAAGQGLARTPASAKNPCRWGPPMWVKIQIVPPGNIPKPTKIDQNGWCTYPNMVPLVLACFDPCFKKCAFLSLLVGTRVPGQKSRKTRFTG